MVNFNDFVKKATGTVQKGIDQVNAKADQFTSTIELQEKMAANEAEIQRLYIEVGKKAVNFGSNFFEAEASRIKHLEAQNVECDRQLLEKKGLMRCPRCKSAIAAKNTFCPECGTRVRE